MRAHRESLPDQNSDFPADSWRIAGCFQAAGPAVAQNDTELLGVSLLPGRIDGAAKPRAAAPSAALLPFLHNTPLFGERVSRIDGCAGVRRGAG